MSTEIIMPKTKTALLAGAAALALTSFAGLAEARSPDFQVMTIELPGRGIGEIRYAGDVAPRIVLAPVAVPVAAWAPAAPLFWAGSPFSVLNQISLEMDRQIASLLHAQAATLRQVARPDGLGGIGTGTIPPGSVGFTSVTTSTGSGVCTQTVRITRAPGEARPNVVSYRSGDCGPQVNGTLPVEVPALRPAERQPRTLSVETEAPPSSARPGNGLLRWTSWRG
jgi:hypothetical protein